ncbi:MULTISPECIES: LysR family transcriptional regulator [Lysinibacillus]|uniref:LysR family transcriptional regulator n=1 Tax=Lysinibacillus fusiformis TaxID=28031 RepID=A0A2I0V1U8_9BACI|nr:MULTISPECIES: LysR family transcriptional regulator [Lysinibacillus]KUF32697.1 LysR family transcriptional regulator [Lysinibacillus sp. F5]MEE3805567.1 LysR family transcriptional regulator [Lysinibacillus fusiformis]PKU52277.1 LysR family transcriptional regulator [Lysinibacillus fusiformis]WCH46715.1 LysR family transcriptional regulator [Lysinibacillus sp. OF-1]SCY99989.1 DNA-binding transcriptional regulator, LysR family [Lysinibacillus sp. SG9]
MNIDHIEAFLYVVHYKSTHKAANALFLSQPTVTARIKSLERELGVELFYRDGRSVSVSEKGKDFIPFATQIVQTFQQGKKQLEETQETDEVCIGANGVTAQYFLAYALPKWKEQFPYLRFQLITGSTTMILEKLQSHQIHLGLIQYVHRDGISNELLLNNAVKLVKHRDHLLQQRERMQAKELAQQKMVFFECGAFDWNYVHKMFEIEGVTANIEVRTDHLEVAKEFIRTKNYISFLPHLCVKKELESGEFVEIDVKHLLDMNQHIFLTYKDKEVLTTAFWQTICETAKQFESMQERH